MGSQIASQSRQPAQPESSPALRRTGLSLAPRKAILEPRRSIRSKGLSRLLEAPQLQRKCSCGGRCPRCSGREELLGVRSIRGTGLRVSEPADRFEREADRAAEQVMRMPDSGMQWQEGGGPRPARSSGWDRAAGGSPTGSSQPLPRSVRSFFEPRFGHDFSRVRVHADQRAAESARVLRANAYTVGHDLVFGAGQYAPGSTRGRRLLAHELAHVVQQGGPQRYQEAPSAERASVPAVSLTAPRATIMRQGGYSLLGPYRRQGRYSLLGPFRPGHRPRLSTEELRIREDLREFLDRMRQLVRRTAPGERVPLAGPELERLLRESLQEGARAPESSQPEPSQLHVPPGYGQEPSGTPTPPPGYEERVPEPPETPCRERVLPAEEPCRPRFERVPGGLLILDFRFEICEGARQPRPARTVCEPIREPYPPEFDERQESWRPPPGVEVPDPPVICFRAFSGDVIHCVSRHLEGELPPPGQTTRLRSR